MRRVALLCGVSLLVWACTGGETSSTTSAAEMATSAVPTTSTTGTSTTAPTTTTSAPPTTSTTAATAVEATSTTAEDHLPIMLRADGLGVVDIGDPVEAVVDRLVEVLGAPVHDDTTVEDGVTYARSLEWSAPQLGVVFNRLDLTTGEWTETLQLTDWVYTGPGGDPGWVLKTPEGITFGSTLLDLRGAFGDDLWLCTLLSEEGDVSWQWGTKENTFGLFGWFDRNPENPDARIVGLHGGWLMPDAVCSVTKLPERGTP